MSVFLSLSAAVSIAVSITIAVAVLPTDDGPVVDAVEDHAQNPLASDRCQRGRDQLVCRGTGLDDQHRRLDDPGQDVRVRDKADWRLRSGSERSNVVLPGHI